MGDEEKALGRRLQQARQRAGLTQQELCQKAGLSYSTLAKIERGAIKAPSVFTVATISRTTGVPLEELLDLKSDAPNSSTKKTSRTGVKFVYFDLNDTLVRAYQKGFAKVAEEAGVPIDTVEVSFWRNNNAVCSGQLSLADFNKEMGQKLGLHDFDWSKYYLDAIEPVPGTAELVDWAYQNYRIGLITAVMPGIVDALAAKGILQLNKFEVVVDSSVVKLLKEDPEIFKLAQAKTNCQPTEILLIDDSARSLVLADELGWQINRFDCYNPEESIQRVKTHLEF